MIIEKDNNSVYLLTNNDNIGIEDVENFLDANYDNYENLEFIEKDRAVANYFGFTTCFIFHNSIVN